MTKGAAIAATVVTAVVVTVIFGLVVLQDGDGTTEATTAPSSPSSTAVPASSGGLHGEDDPPEVPLDAATHAALESELEIARAAAARFPDARAASEAGYYRGVPYESGIGTHWVNFGAIDARLDPGEPEMLLFASDADDAPLVGLTYYVYDSRGEPEGFPGANDHWHQHVSVCVGRKAVYTDPGDAALNGCGPGRARNGWMLHAWVAPGHHNPRGVFATRNPTLP